MHIGCGETVGILGASGAGKTTLALIVAGLMQADSGELLLDGEPICSGTSRGRKRLHDRIQIVWQQPATSFNPRWKIRRSLMEPYRLHGLKAPQASIERLLDRVGLGTDLLDRHPRELSGGELQRLAIARALAVQPELMVLDEPTSMLDAITQARIIRLLEEIQRMTGVGYLFISHDRQLMRLLSHRAFVLQEGLLTQLPMNERESH